MAAETQTREQQRQRNREAMPEVTAFIDAFREHFPDLKVIYASENGITHGKPSED